MFGTKHIAGLPFSDIHSWPHHKFTIQHVWHLLLFFFYCLPKKSSEYIRSSCSRWMSLIMTFSLCICCRSRPHIDYIQNSFVPFMEEQKGAETSTSLIKPWLLCIQIKSLFWPSRDLVTGWQLLCLMNFIRSHENLAYQRINIQNSFVNGCIRKRKFIYIWRLYNYQYQNDIYVWESMTPAKAVRNDVT